MQSFLNWDLSIKKKIIIIKLRGIWEKICEILLQSLPVCWKTCGRLTPLHNAGWGGVGWVGKQCPGGGGRAHRGIWGPADGWCIAEWCAGQGEGVTLLGEVQRCSTRWGRCWLLTPAGTSSLQGGKLHQSILREPQYSNTPNNTQLQILHKVTYNNVNNSQFTS